MRPTSSKKKKTRCYIHKLPPEILGQIFELAVSEDFAFRANDVRSPSSPILHVCQYWRELAFTTSKLWFRFFISDQEFCPPGMLRELQLWLKRVKNCPLEVTFWTCRSKLDDPTDSQIPIMWRLLLSKRANWICLNYSNNSGRLLYILTESGGSGFPLTSLSLSLQNLEHTSSGDVPSMLLPDLKLLKLEGNAVHYLIDAPKLSKMTLRDTRVSCAALARMSAMYSLLEVLSLNNVAVEELPSDSYPIIFTRLREFGWNTQHGDFVDLSLVASCPNVQSLRIGISSLRLSKPKRLTSVTKLTIILPRVLPDPENMLPILFRNLPNLTLLLVWPTTSVKPGEDTLAVVFMQTLLKNEICPLLQDVAFHHVKIPIGLLCSLARSRFSGIRSHLQMNSPVTIKISTVECKGVPNMKRASYPDLLDTLQPENLPVEQSPTKEWLKLALAGLTDCGQQISRYQPIASLVFIAIIPMLANFRRGRQ